MTDTTPDQSASATPRRIEYRALSQLTEDPRNPKSHAIDTVTASVGRFGFIEPVVVDERTGYLISGHGRTKVLRAMYEKGEGAPNGVRVDEETGEWQVPVVAGWASRTDLDASGALIALNRAGELGGWVDDALLDLLDDLSEDDEYGFEGVGFGDTEIENLRYKLSAMDDENVADNSWEEWDAAGMSEYESTNEYAPKVQAHVSFKSQEDADEFARLLGWPSFRKRAWFPWQEDDVTSDIRYVEEAPEEE